MRPSRLVKDRDAIPDLTYVYICLLTYLLTYLGLQLLLSEFRLHVSDPEWSSGSTSSFCRPYLVFQPFSRHRCKNQQKLITVRTTESLTASGQ